MRILTLFSLYVMFSLPVSARNSKPLIVTSTPDIAWFLEQLASERILVEALVNSVEDLKHPEKISEFQLKSLVKADLICTLGRNIDEEWLEYFFFHSNVPEGAKSCRIGDAFDKPAPPYYWLNPWHLRTAIERLHAVISEKYPKYKEEFATNFKSITKNIEYVFSKTKNRLQSQLPKSTLLITTSPAFVTFMQAYDYKITLVSPQELNKTLQSQTPKLVVFPLSANREETEQIAKQFKVRTLRLPVSASFNRPWATFELLHDYLASAIADEAAAPRHVKIKAKLKTSKL